MDLVFTSDKLIISKQSAHWKSWQNKLFFYKASLSFNNEAELVEYLQFDYKLSEADIEKISATISDNNFKTFELNLPQNGKSLDIKKVALDILNSEKQLIFWEDWFYVLSRKEDDVFLWVYLGGIAEMVKEIKLSEKQKKLITENGEPDIRELAIQLQTYNSPVYLEAIQENRKIL